MPDAYAIRARFYDLGRAEDGMFNMTRLALSFASEVNGVSRLHGTASKALLNPFWPGLLCRYLLLEAEKD